MTPRKLTFTQLPIALGRGNNLILPDAENGNLFPSAAEPLAVAHWLLGGVEYAPDLVSGQMYAAGIGGGGGTGFDVGANYISTRIANGINTQITSGYEQTIITTFQYNTAATGMVIFDDGYDSVSQIGTQISTDVPNSRLNMVTDHAPQAVTTTIPNAAGLANNNWAWCSLSSTLKGDASQRFSWGKASGLIPTRNPPKYFANSINYPIGIGVPFVPAAAPVIGKYAEIIVYDFALTDAQLQQIYNRSTVRLAARGITLF